MLNTSQGKATHRRPTLALVPWGSGLGAWDPIDTQTGEAWHPRGAELVTLGDEGEPQRLVQGLIDHELGAVLLIGRSHTGGGIQLQTRAENRDPETGQRHDPLAEGVVRATLSTSEILRDLETEGLEARAVSNAEPDVGSHLLYQILSQLPDQLTTPPVGLLRLPRDMAPAQVNQAIRSVASSIARHLPPKA